MFYRTVARVPLEQRMGSPHTGVVAIGSLIMVDIRLS
jgi:hypothetical protein